jgi:hypothetical protein
MAAQPLKPLTAARVWTCVLINQFATPGLGSIMCGRRISGAGQLGLALTGFVLLIGWMLLYSYQLATRGFDTWTPDKANAWVGKWGLIFFGAGWAWALFTSIGLLLGPKAEEPRIPPRITKPPGQM